MLEQQGTLCRLGGDVTLDTVPDLIEQIRPLIRSGIDTIDCAGVKSVDSSALGLFLACKREALTHNKRLSLTGLAPSLLSLASLYGVSDQLLLPPSRCAAWSNSTGRRARWTGLIW